MSAAGLRRGLSKSRHQYRAEPCDPGSRLERKRVRGTSIHDDQMPDGRGKCWTDFRWSMAAFVGPAPSWEGLSVSGCLSARSRLELTSAERSACRVDESPGDPAIEFDMCPQSAGAEAATYDLRYIYLIWSARKPKVQSTCAGNGDGLGLAPRSPHASGAANHRGDPTCLDCLAAGRARVPGVARISLLDWPIPT